jgi:hypothetical protein
VAEGYVAWQIAGEGELIDAVIVKFEWEKKLPEMKEGEAMKIDLPALKAIGVDRFWGQITASKAESIEITPADGDKGLRPIDPQRDLMPGPAVTDAARAWEFQGDWTLALEATRYKLQDVKRTSIDRAFVRMVVTRRSDRGPGPVPSAVGPPADSRADSGYRPQQRGADGALARFAGPANQ